MGKPGPKCSICKHTARHQIDVGLTHRVSYRALAARFDVSADAVKRHADNHLSPAQRAAILAAQKPTAIDLDKLEVTESEGLLAALVTQRARLQTHSEMAADMGDVKAAVSAEKAITGNLDLVAKLLGRLVQRHEVRSTSLLISPDYLKLRATLVDALKPFPDAARAVGAALHRLESEAATEIAPKPKPLAHTIEHKPATATAPPPPLPPPPY